LAFTPGFLFLPRRRGELPLSLLSDESDDEDDDEDPESESLPLEEESLSLSLLLPDESESLDEPLDAASSSSFEVVLRALGAAAPELPPNAAIGSAQQEDE
jgi:hypothetical protein